MNFGFWNFSLVKIIADYVNFHMTYHKYIWNHAGWHRSVLNMTHFQLFAWFGQTLLVRKMENKSKFLLGDTIGSKFNFKWSSWSWTMSSYQNLRSIKEHGGYRSKNVQKNCLSVSKIFCQFSHFFKTFLKLKIWFLMMILMANQPI